MEFWISGIQEVGIVKRNAGKRRDAAHRMCCLLLIIIIVMPYNRRLDRTTTAYCEQTCRDHEKQKRKQVSLHRNGYEDCFRTEHYDLPAAAVTCSNGSHKASEYSRGVKEAHVLEPLRSEIEKLGRIGERRNDGSCNNTLGRCAEQHAASTLQNRKYSYTPPARLQFSKAMRPRTMEVVEYCKNCKDIFNL